MDKLKYKKKAKEQIDVLFDRLEQIEQESANLTQDFKNEIKEKLDDLKHRKDELSKDYKALQEVAAEKWDEAEKAFTKSKQVVEKKISEIAEMF